MSGKHAQGLKRGYKTRLRPRPSTASATGDVRLRSGDVIGGDKVAAMSGSRITEKAPISCEDVASLEQVEHAGRTTGGNDCVSEGELTNLGAIDMSKVQVSLCVLSI